MRVHVGQHSISNSPDDTESMRIELCKLLQRTLRNTDTSNGRGDITEAGKISNICVGMGLSQCIIAYHCQ